MESPKVTRNSTRKRKLIEKLEENEKKKPKILNITDFKCSITSPSNIKDLITIGNEWNLYKKEMDKDKDTFMKIKRLRRKYYNIIDQNEDFHKVSKITKHLEKLDNLTGMESLKKSIVNQILFFTQNLQNDEMMHTILSGSPGTGKTSVAKILGEIYKDLGILKKGTFTKACRDDFIGEYLGSTAIKTKKLLKSCLGGVLFIDEAYSLGNREKRDSFSKEAIDTLNEFLSENTKDFICIIAGYEKSLHDCFFSWNPGLERRFPWKFKLDGYNPKELKEILYYQVKNNGWMISVDDDKLEKIIIKNKDLFKYNGGDCLVYFDKCKICHARRVFGKNQDEKFNLTNEDIVQGMMMFQTFKKTNKIKDTSTPLGMYV
jgi:SpoVK/Ycf46/Vps4 family AAA+-type ATPase